MNHYTIFSLGSPPPCDGCNCPMMISMDPDDDNSRTLTLDSPQYPSLYPNNQICTWTITATYGQLAMVFNKFTVQSDSTCSKDYLQISGPIKKYRRARLCGFPVTTLLSPKYPDPTEFSFRFPQASTSPRRNLNLSSASSLTRPSGRRASERLLLPPD